MPKRTGRPWRERIVPYVLERDAGICHLCGQPGADSADHITPVNHGGDVYNPDNLAAVHHKVEPRCNVRRGDRSVEQARAFMRTYLSKRTTTPEWTW